MRLLYGIDSPPPGIYSSSVVRDFLPVVNDFIPVVINFFRQSVFTDFNRYAAKSPCNTAEAGIAGDIHGGGTGLTSFEAIHLTIAQVSNGCFAQS
jgi:hypothetical protein